MAAAGKTGGGKSSAGKASANKATSDVPKTSFVARLLWWLAVSAPTVAAGILTFKHLSTESAPFMDPLMETCKAQTAGVANPLLKFYEFSNCFIIPFFKEVIGTPEGTVIWVNICALAGTFGAFMATESSRFGTFPPLSFHALYMLFFVFIGISIGVPLLWLPTYFAVGIRHVRTPQQMGLSWPRVAAIFSLNVAILIPEIAALFTWEDHTLNLAIKAAIWTPILAPLAWLLFPIFATSDLEKARQAALFMHSFFAGVGLVCHAGTVLFLLANQDAAEALRGLLSSHPGGAVCSYFLLVDLAVFYLSLVYAAAVEDGLLAGVAILLAAPLLGLGTPLSFYYMHRESKIWAQPAALRKQKAA